MEAEAFDELPSNEGVKGEIQMKKSFHCKQIKIPHQTQPNEGMGTRDIPQTRHHTQ